MALWSPQTNNAQTTINQGGGIGAGDATVTVASATGFPVANIHYHIIIDSEIMEVTAGQATTTWSITRAQSGTTAATHANTSVVTEIATWEMFTNLFPTKIDEATPTTNLFSFPNLITAIPTTFSHLAIALMGRQSGANTEDNIYLRFNADAGANYIWGLEQQTNNAAPTGTTLSGQIQAEAGNFPGANAPANYAGALWIDILNYKDTTFNKTYISRWTEQPSGTVNLKMSFGSGNWGNTAAITQIQMFVGTGASTFISGTKAYLYGIP